MKWKGWRVEENIWKTFKKKMKARPEGDHRLQLQQRAAVMEAITRALRRTESWPSEPQLTPSSSSSSPKRPSRSPWLLSKGSPRGQAKVAHRKEEVHYAIRTSHLMASRLNFLCVFCRFHFSWFFCVFCGWDFLAEVFNAGVCCTVSHPCSKENFAVWGPHLLL